MYTELDTALANFDKAMLSVESLQKESKKLSDQGHIQLDDALALESVNGISADYFFQARGIGERCSLAIEEINVKIVTIIIAAIVAVIAIVRKIYNWIFGKGSSTDGMKAESVNKRLEEIHVAQVEVVKQINNLHDPNKSISTFTDPIMKSFETLVDEFVENYNDKHKYTHFFTSNGFKNSLLYRAINEKWDDNNPNLFGFCNSHTQRDKFLNKIITNEKTYNQILQYMIKSVKSGEAFKQTEIGFQYEEVIAKVAIDNAEIHETWKKEASKNNVHTDDFTMMREIFFNGKELISKEDETIENTDIKRLLMTTGINKLFSNYVDMFDTKLFEARVKFSLVLLEQINLNMPETDKLESLMKEFVEVANSKLTKTNVDRNTYTTRIKPDFDRVIIPGVKNIISSTRLMIDCVLHYNAFIFSQYTRFANTQIALFHIYETYVKACINAKLVSDTEYEEVQKDMKPMKEALTNVRKIADLLVSTAPHH